MAGRSIPSYFMLSLVGMLFSVVCPKVDWAQTIETGVFTYERNVLPLNLSDIRKQIQKQRELLSDSDNHSEVPQHVLIEYETSDTSVTIHIPAESSNPHEQIKLYPKSHFKSIIDNIETIVQSTRSLPTVSDGRDPAKNAVEYFKLYVPRGLVKIDHEANNDFGYIISQLPQEITPGIFYPLGLKYPPVHTSAAAWLQQNPPPSMDERARLVKDITKPIACLHAISFALDDIKLNDIWIILKSNGEYDSMLLGNLADAKELLSVDDIKGKISILMNETQLALVIRQLFPADATPKVPWVEKAWDVLDNHRGTVSQLHSIFSNHDDSSLQHLIDDIGKSNKCGIVGDQRTTQIPVVPRVCRQLKLNS